MLTDVEVPRIFRPMKTQHHTVPLSHVAVVRQGHPFRGAIPSIDDGTVSVIQVRNLSSADGMHPTRFLRTTVRPGKVPDWAVDGDVLLAGRGNSPSAVLLSAPPPNTLCSPHIYVIRIMEGARLLPAFLAWQLNQSGVQAQLRRESAGTRQPSVCKGSVEELKICTPPVDLQRRIVSISDAAHAEACLIRSIIQKREMELTAITERLLHRSS